MTWQPYVVTIAGCMQLISGVVHVVSSDRPALATIRSLGADAYWQRRLQATLFAGSITRAVVGIAILYCGLLYFHDHVEVARGIVMIVLLPPASSAVLIPLLTPSDARKAVAHGAIVVLAAAGLWL